MPTAGYCALVVDDEPTQRQTMMCALQRSGFHCDPAATGRQALELLRGQKYDVVITDLSMPDINGHRVAVELLEKEQRPVVIIVTGITEPKIERDLWARGVDEILFKPINNIGLAARAERLIGKRASRVVPIAPPITNSLPDPLPVPVPTSALPAKSVATAAAAPSALVSTVGAGNKQVDWIDQLAEYGINLRPLCTERNLLWASYLVTFHLGMLAGWLLGRHFE